MENISEYEIAQKRIKVRRQKKRELIIFGVIEVVIIALGLTHPGSGTCIVPTGAIAAFIIASKAIQYYYLSPQQIPSQTQLDQELEWLFGENGQASIDTLEYAFAQDHIRKRQVQKWKFVLFYPLIFLPVAGFLLISDFQTPGKEQLVLLVFPFAIVHLLWGIRKHFPSQSRLAKIERQAGEELRRELQSMRPEKLKHEEKRKREPIYEVGDDGELVEIDEVELSEIDKPKRDSL